MTTTSLLTNPQQHQQQQHQQHQQHHQQTNYSTDIIDDNTGIQFDDLAQSRGRQTRAASLALDKDQTFLNPSHLIHSSRRHSSHYCPPTLTESNLILQNLQNQQQHKQQQQQQQQQLHQHQQQQQQPSKQQHQNTITTSSTATTYNPTVLITTQQNLSPKHQHHQQQQQQQQQQLCSIVPPPVPKRTFQGKQQHKENPAYRTRLNSAQQPQPQNQAAINFCNQRQRRYSENSDENDDNFSLSPLSLDDKDKLDDIIIYDRANPGLIKSGQSSSSDSNKSQTTIDTGYMSSSINDIDRQPIFTIGQRDTPVFRNRFSSEDTQSSMDSYMSSDYPNNSEILDSPQNKYDSVFILPNNNCTNPGGLNNNNSGGNNIHGGGNGSMKTRKFVKNTNENIDGALNRRLPAVPVRKQISVPPKIPPPIIKQSSANSIRSRGTSTSSTSSTPPPPPPPPLRSQASLDSGKLFQNGHMLGAFQSSTYTANVAQNKENNLQEMHNRPPMPIKKGIHGAHKPPPLTQVHHSKVNQRQDSNISSDSCSFASSSPGYNSKSMEVPLLQYAPKINNKTGIRHQDSNDSFNMITRNGICGNGANSGIGSSGKKINVRQDSNISSDSQTSSPGYNTKLMEAPLLAHACKLSSIRQGYRGADEILKENSSENCPSTPITKSVSTPASLQTIVRIQNGSNMSLQHKILKARKNSNPYVTRGRLKFRLFQILINAVALLAIAGGLAAYFNAYPTVKFVNKTIITTTKVITSTEDPNVGKNPAPGVCLPVIVKFCQNNHLPYNFTLFPNYIGHFGQPEAQMELDAYEALIDVRCYELVSLFLCSLFVPKCSSSGTTVPPCRSLCYETMRRCGFFFDVFGLELPEYLTCQLFAESQNPDECVGMKEVREAKIRAQRPNCAGFLCDQKRCLPSEWRCDGHVDCSDQTDESNCNECGKGSIYCGERRCMSQKHVCDGVMDCPWGQDERNCIRLSERNGDLGRGRLEIYKAGSKQWAPACVTHWDPSTSPTTVCSMLGYSSVNSSKLTMRDTNTTIAPPTKDTPAMWRMYQKKNTNLMKEFTSCPINSQYPVVELTCSNFECGKIRNRRYKASTRIVGGTISSPGDWPFLAAILGGPEEIFYCAGVLIADQWILTASHCIGNHTLRNINDWTIQLGITRRHSHTYYGQKVKVRNVIPHPQYNSNVAHDNDIALFQLATRVAFHEHLLPVCLPPALRELKPGTECTVIGWGKKEDKSSSTNSNSATYEAAVNEVQVPILNRDLCNDWLETLNVTEGMICAGYPEGGKDACQGDSGGPLLCRDPNDRERWFVGGIVSWGIMCAHPRLPGVYANVPRYIPWIMQQIHKFSNNHNDNFMNL